MHYLYIAVGGAIGAPSRLQTARLLRVSEDLPLVIEIVDSETDVQRLLPFLDEVIEEGMVTTEKVRILHYHARRDTR